MNVPLKNPMMITPGYKIHFVYNGAKRIGTVERVGKRSFTIKHSNPENHNGKIYSNYSFDKLTGAISLLL